MFALLCVAMAAVIARADGQPPPRVRLAADNMVITRSCIIEVPDTPIVDADGDGVIHIDTPGVVVDFEGGLLRGSPDSLTPDGYAGIGVRIGAESVTLRNAKVAGFKVGVWAARADGLVIENCDASGNFRQRLRSTPDAEDLADWLWPHENDENQWAVNYGAGFYIEQSSGVTVRNCTATAGQNGLCLREVTGSKVYDNDFSFLSGWGIAMFRCSGNTIARNSCDFCIRGYSHGVYSRGQDSAGILMFEQCRENVIALNSATHGGDGLFGFAGREALGQNPAPEPGFDYAGKGNAQNLIVGNDFSFAAAIGVEMTFSTHNAIAWNTLNGCNYGVWGGYSNQTVVRGNTITDNTIAGIAIEHGSKWQIDQNTFARNARAVQVWHDEDPDLAATPWARANDTGTHSIALFRNTFADEPVGIELRGGVTGTAVLENTFTQAGAALDAPRIDADAASTVVLNDERMAMALRALDVPRPEELDLPGTRTAVGARKHLAGRDRIIMTEWGPFDWKGTRVVRMPDDPATGAARIRFLNPPAAASYSQKGDGGMMLQLAPHSRIAHLPPGPADVTRYTLTARADPHWAYNESGYIVAPRWSVRFFATSADPREEAGAFAQDAEQGVAVDGLRVLNFAFSGGGPSDLPRWSDDKDQPEPLDAVRAAGLPRDRFGVVATAKAVLPPGRYRVRLTSDDGVRFIADGKAIIDDWTWHAPTTHEAELVIDREREVPLRVEYFELDGHAVLSVAIDRVGD